MKSHLVNFGPPSLYFIFAERKVKSFKVVTIMFIKYSSLIKRASLIESDIKKCDLSHDKKKPINN